MEHKLWMMFVCLVFLNLTFISGTDYGYDGIPTTSGYGYDSATATSGTGTTIQTNNTYNNITIINGTMNYTNIALINQSNSFNNTQNISILSSNDINFLNLKNPQNWVSGSLLQILFSDGTGTAGAIGLKYNSATGTVDVVFNSLYNNGYQTSSYQPFIFSGNGNENVSGNITASYFKGNGSQLTSVCLTNGTNCQTYAQYQFTNNNFNGSGNFTTTGSGKFGNSARRTILDDGYYSINATSDKGAYFKSVQATAGTPDILAIIGGYYFGNAGTFESRDGGGGGYNGRYSVTLANQGNTGVTVSNTATTDRVDLLNANIGTGHAIDTTGTNYFTDLNTGGFFTFGDYGYDNSLINFDDTGGNGGSIGTNNYAMDIWSANTASIRTSYGGIGSGTNEVKLSTSTDSIATTGRISSGKDIIATGNITTSTGSGYSGKVVCYLAAGKLGHCTSVVGVTGGCTCASN